MNPPIQSMRYRKPKSHERLLTQVLCVRDKNPARKFGLKWSINRVNSNRHILFNEPNTLEEDKMRGPTENPFVRIVMKTKNR